MDYKHTLNLPRTGFPMKADLVAHEPQRVELWEASNLYDVLQRRRAGAPRFVLHDGPPFANGEVHIGTALNKIIKDVIVKYKSIRGMRAPFVPGWDCHGLPIEFKVTQEMRKAGVNDADPVRIRRACEAYAHKYIDLQRGQFKRLGVLADWSRPYLTLDRAYEAEELRLFASVVEKGFVYRGKKPVYWSIPCRTALAEAEVEYADHVSPSTYVKFPVQGHPNTFILIWTTTPWTLPANLAVAYHSSYSYAQVRVGEESYILSNLLLPAVAAKCGWAGYEIIRSLHAEHVSQIEYQHPFCARTGRLLAGDAFVDNTTGTGLVHIAPGHGLEDYGLGSQNGLPIYSPVDDNGCLVHTDDLPVEQQFPMSLVGKSILEKHGKSEANLAVLEELRSRNALLHQEDFHHSYPHCWRSKTPVIFRAMDQWFIRIDHDGFRGRVLDEMSRVQWVPAWGKNRMEAAVSARPDWCISRQRTWGVPIPAFYDAEGKPLLDAEIVRLAADVIEREGSHYWFEKSCAELWAAVRPARWNGPAPASKGVDTLDVWIDSGSSSRAVLMQNADLSTPSATPNAPASWQADLYAEGSDQHRGWFQSSLLLSMAGNGVAPYRGVLTHGFMVDADKEKISKSNQGQGGYEKPQTADAYVKKYGADVVRLWVVSQDVRNDVVVSDDRISKVGETYRVIRNALRYQLSNLYDFDPAKHAVPEAHLTRLDRWILTEFSKLETAVAQAYDAYEFHVVYQRTSQFAAVDLSAVYHDLVKDRLYTDAANSPRRRSTQTALHRLVTGLSKLLSPILSFTTDEAWEFIPGKSDPSVHLSVWQPSALVQSGEESRTWARLFEVRDRVLDELERARQLKSIGKSLEAIVTLKGSEVSLAEAQLNADDLRELLNVSQLSIQKDTAATSESDITVTVAHAGGQKCERCWRWELDVSANAAHPTLCGRCVNAVSAAG